MSYRTPSSRDPVGWDDESIAEFDRRWLRGDTIAEIARAFNIGPTWVTRLRKRRALPTRCGPDGRYRGGSRPNRSEEAPTCSIPADRS